MKKLHQGIIERIQFMIDSIKDMEVEDKKMQMRLIFESMSQQTDIGLLIEEISAVSFYSLHDLDAILHVNVMYKKRKTKGT